MALSLGKRWEILERDDFTCQYCGKRAPDVVLEVDHIHPQSKGGDHDPDNLITSCYDCNQGKRAKIIGSHHHNLYRELQYVIDAYTPSPVEALALIRQAQEEALENLLMGLHIGWSHTIFEVTGLRPQADFELIVWAAMYSEREIWEVMEEIAARLSTEGGPYRLDRIYTMMSRTLQARHYA